jgi:hypothetical protein
VVEGEFGNIEEISSAYVVIAVWDQRRLIVPLSYFLERPFQNWTLHSSALVQPIYIQLDYSVPVDVLRNELHAILHSTPLWDGRVWNLQVSDLKERTMELRALVSAANASQAWDLRCYVREQLVRVLQMRFPGAPPLTRISIEPEPQASKALARSE